MLSPVTKTFGDVSVTFMPRNLLEVAALDVRVAQFALPFLDALGIGDSLEKLLDVKAEVDFSRVLSAVRGTIAALSPADAVSLIADSLKGATLVYPGHAPVTANEQTISEAFAGDLQSIYLATFEAWRYLKLTPFTLAARFGVATAPTATSGQAEPTPRPCGPGLALSGQPTRT